MRTALTALLAFAAGVLLMLWLPGHAPAPAVVGAPTAATANDAATASSVADGSEDVFRNEAEYAARMFRQRFGASAHALVLENNPASLATHPLASWSNLEGALDGLA